MPILNSKDLWAERKRLTDAQAALMNDDKVDEARIVEGQIKQLDLTLDHVIDEENELRTSPKPCAAAGSFGERILGPRDQFSPLDNGWRNEATVVSVGAPFEADLDLPSKGDPLFQNFAATLLETPAIGSVNYKQRDTQVGNPDKWGGVTEGNSATKAKVLYKFKDAVANKETIAGYVPVSKDSLADYDELLDIINHDLVRDLWNVTDEHYLSGNNSTGIIGILNTAGIQTFADKMGGMYYDAICMMRTKVMEASDRIPTHVVMSPQIRQAIRLYKTSTGLYQTLGNDDTYWGMQVVEDTKCPGILVYDCFAARRRSIHDTTVEVGYVNDQFIKNELCLLAEHTKALQVLYPDAFCYATKEALDQKAV